jgi:hypothetical protein
MNVIMMLDFKYDSLTELIGTFSDEQKCIAYLEDAL